MQTQVEPNDIMSMDNQSEARSFSTRKSKVYYSKLSLESEEYFAEDNNETIVEREIDENDVEVRNVKDKIRVAPSNTDEAKEKCIKLKQQISIPPRSEAICLAIRENVELRSVIMIEPTAIQMDGILAARIVTTGRKKKVMVKLMNVSNSEVIVSAKTIIGYEHVVQPFQPDIITHLQEINIEATFKIHHLKQTDQIRMKDLITEYQDIFMYEGCTLGCTSKVTHQIITENVHPIARPPYRVPVTQRDILRNEIDALLDQGIIEESTSPWSAPVVLVNKITPDGGTKIRLCIDFRMLNSITKKDFLPLPNLQETIEELNEAAVFTTLDLASGYHLVGIAEADKEKTAFSTLWGHYQWNRMPFGLCNAPSTFQRLMNCILSSLTNESCYVYLDDIIVFIKNNVNEHIARLRKVFDRLQKHNLKLKSSKCSFIMKEVSYLGHIFSEEGAKPDPTKREAIRTYPTPRNVKDIRAFLCLVGFYRRFIKNFSATAKPLTKLLKKDECYI